MTTRLLATIPLCIAFGPGAVAQDAVLPSTKLMREQGQLLYRDINGMAKGEAPFSAERARQNMSRLIDTSGRIPAAFPETSKGRTTPESRYAASPKIWEARADFESKAARLASELKATEASVTTLDGLKAAATRVNDACNDCHTVYRERR